MKKYINKNIFKNFIIYFSLIFISEIIFKVVNFFRIFDWSLLRIILSSVIISLIISFVLYFVPKKMYKFINPIIMFIISIYSLAQSAFNNFIGVYMSLGTSSQLGAVIDYIREYILSFKWFYYFQLIPFVLCLIYYIFFDKMVNKKFKIKEKKNLYKKLNKKDFIKKGLVSIGSILFLFGLYISTLFIPFMQNELQTVSNRKLFNNPSVPSIAIKQFGILEFGILDVENHFFPSEETTDYKYETNVKKKLENVTRKFDDDEWNKLIKNESNENLNNLNKFFIDNDITDTNDSTGIFENKNLIVIMMESANDIFINKDDYPNFYKLYSEGWHWKNNFSPRNSCSTGNNEMSGMISLYSIYNTCTANEYEDNTYFESIFNLFNNKGYQTFSAHDYTEHYYDRSIIHPNMGSGHYYGVEELGIKYSNQYRNWASDEDFMTEVLNIIDNVDKDHFMAWLTTVSSHQPYFNVTIEGETYYDLYKDLDIRTDLKRYKSKLKILDNALGILMDGLDEKGILDDTVIVLYGDHYPYGLSTNAINDLLDYDTNVDYDAERVPFVIYNSEMQAKEYDEYTSYINILPTVANLFNLDYDPRLYVGTDILSKDYESMVVFADGSWKNEYAYYNASKAEIKYYKDKTYEASEIQAINEKIDLKMKMSSLAIKNNYFNYLYNGLHSTKDNVTTTETVKKNNTAS